MQGGGSRTGHSPSSAVRRSEIFCECDCLASSSKCWKLQDQRQFVILWLRMHSLLILDRDCRDDNDDMAALKLWLRVQFTINGGFYL